jgi:hypothetical protein
MSKEKKLTAIAKRAENRTALAPFAMSVLRAQLPLTFPVSSELPNSPKRKYRSEYQYLGWEGLEKAIWADGSPFEFQLYLIDYRSLERLLAYHIYQPSAKGQVPFDPLSMYLLVLYRRDRDLSRPEVLRQLRHPKEGQELRRWAGFKDEYPSESGLRYFESCLTPELQGEINALQMDMLYQASLLPTKPEAGKKVTLSFDGMLHEARSRMRCSSVQESCYEPAPRPCPAQEKKKQGCDCTSEACVRTCRSATPRDPAARLIVYTGSNKRAKTTPNTPQDGRPRSPWLRFTYGYYSYAAQMLDDELSTYWILPAAFGTATCGDKQLFPDNFSWLRARFPWLKIGAVINDAALCEQRCLDLIWDAGALRMVDIAAHKSDQNPQIRLDRGYDENGHPLCPMGHRLRSNGHNYKRRQTKWRCSKQCRFDPERPLPECDYLEPKYKHGYTVNVGRTHADGTVRLAREIPYGTPAWKERYNRRNSSESRNGVLEHFGLKCLPVHGLSAGHVAVMQGDFIANLRTLIRLIRQAAALGLT